jgi:tetratricopeptide (TPR) repeat protein
MPFSAFIIRPFGKKDVLLPGEKKTVDGELVRVSKLVEVDFEDVHKKLIQPAMERLNIAADTTGSVAEAGNIREDMFHLLMTADLVVADLSIHNPNVFYEVGIRHAFRDKSTVLIRSEGNDDPFDLKTDRYFEYDREQPEKSVDGLYRVIRATLASERTDSPVFRLLPGIRVMDRSGFISVPRDFQEDVERARKQCRGGDLRLLAVESAGFLWEVEALRQIGRAQFDLNFIEGARDSWEEIARRYPDDLEANIVLSTVYQRVSEGTRSEQALTRLANLTISDINTRAEVKALIGRNLKSRWQDSWYPQAAQVSGGKKLEKEDSAMQPGIRERALKSPLLRRAREAYAEAFRENLNYIYAGISALTLLIVEVSLAKDFPEAWALRTRDEDETGRVLKVLQEEIRNLSATLEYALAAERKRLASTNQIDFWFEIMEAAFLGMTSANTKRVKQSYFEATLWAPRYAEVSMRRSLRLFIDLGTKHPNHPAVDLQANTKAALEAIRGEEVRKEGGKIILFVGLRAEATNGFYRPCAHGENQPIRFLTAEMQRNAELEIRKAIERERNEHGPLLFGMAAGASGSDLMFHEICDALEIDTKLYLALPKDEYVGEYVAPAGAHWVERFNKVYERLRVACRRKLEADQVRSSEIDTELVISVLGDSKEMPRWLQGKSPYTVGKRNAVWMLQHALVQRDLHDSDKTKVTMIVLWDRNKVDTNGSIADLVDKAEQQGIKVVHINCAQWGRGEPAVIGSGDDGGPPCEPAKQSLRALEAGVVNNGARRRMRRTPDVTPERVADSTRRAG